MLTIFGKDKRTQNLVWFACLIIILIMAIFVRLQYILKSDWILGDGGMFYQMILELEENQFRIPDYSSYNLDTIPFAYPFFSFYLAGFLHQYGNLDLIQIFRYLPLIFNLAILPVAFLFFNRFLKNRWKALFAFSLYALPIESFDWMLLGGGLTRSPGYFFYFAALLLWLMALEEEKLWMVIGTGVLVGLTGLTHSGIFYALVLTIIVFTFYKKFDRQRMIRLVIVGGVSFLVLLLWLVPVLSHHGLMVIKDGFSSGEHFNFQFLKNVLMVHGHGVLLFVTMQRIALVLLLIKLLKKEFFLPAWYLVLMVFVSRQVEILIIIPTVILLVERITDFFNITLKENISTYQVWLMRGGLVFFYLAVFAALIGEPIHSTTMTNNTLSQADRDAMAWIQENTQLDETFLIVPLQENTIFLTAEWFPALAERRSVLTIQGLEWVNNFTQQMAIYNYLTYELELSYDDFFSSLDRFEINYDYLYCSDHLTGRMVNYCPEEIEGHQTVYLQDDVLVYHLETP